MFEELSDLYQELILDHSKSPRNFGNLPNATHRAAGRNPLCGDELAVYIRMEDNVIGEIRFEGSGCAISKASASLMTEAVKGRTEEEVRQLFNLVHQMLTTGKVDRTLPEKLWVFAGVSRFPARVKCASLPWHTLIAALDQKQQPVSTE